MTSPVETVLREEWGRLLALLVARFRRLDLAEDALADAFEQACRVWPRDGPPANPAGWLLTAARNRALDRLRADAVLARRMVLLATDPLATDPLAVDPLAWAEAVSPGQLLDERLRLVLLCAHPTLSREAAAALSLRLVLGVPTEEIARLFLVPTATMAARLTRAKKRLAGARFDIPADADTLGERVGIVAEIAYLAFTAGYAPGAGADVVRERAAGEAIRLVRVLREVLPAAVSEIDALLALMLLHHSRRAARVHDGQLVLLPDQDRARWHQEDIVEAVGLLAPLATAPPAPYLLQALIAAEHAIAPTAAQTAWGRVVARYDELLSIHDTPVVRLNRAVAVAERDGPAAGLAALASVALPGHRLPAVRAHFLAQLGRDDDARAAFDQAIALCPNAMERQHLTARRAEAGQATGSRPAGRRRP